MANIQLTPEQIAALQQSKMNLDKWEQDVNAFGRAGFDNTALKKNHQAALKGATGLLREFGGQSPTKSK